MNLYTYCHDVAKQQAAAAKKAAEAAVQKAAIDKALKDANKKAADKDKVSIAAGNKSTFAVQETGNSVTNTSSAYKTAVDNAGNVLQGFSAGVIETITYGVSGKLDNDYLRTNEKIYVISKIVGNGVAGIGGTVETGTGLVYSIGTGGLGAI